MNKILVLVLTALLWASSSAHATLITFANESGWQRAVGTFNTETFGTAVIATQETLTFPDSGITSTYVPNSDQQSRGQIHRVIPAPSISSDLCTGACFVSTVSSTHPLSGVAVWDLGMAVNAWGGIFDLSPSSQDLIAEMYTGGFGGSLVDSVNISNLLASPSGFAGIISDTTFDTIVWTDDGGLKQTYVADNFQYGVAAVPEPSTLMLLGIGLVGLGWMGQRKKRSQ